MVVDLQGVGNNVQEHFHAGITYRAAIRLAFSCHHDTENIEQK